MKYLIISLSVLLISCSQSVKEKKADLKLSPPAGPNSSLPYLTTGSDGFLYMSWVEKRDSNWVDLKYSKLVDNVWTKSELVATGDDWFVNWADYPMITVDQEGNMAAHYLAKSSAGTYSYDVNVMVKRNKGTWKGPFIPHRDGTPTEHGFVTSLAKNDATFQLAWLDGRNTGSDAHHEHGQGGAMTIRTAIMDLEGGISDEFELDNRVCDCCQTTGVMTKNGAAFMYRDRSEMEIRDMAFVRRTVNGWTSPENFGGDSWEVKGCPVNGPSASVFENSVAIAWFTAPEKTPQVKLIFSPNSVDSFSEPIIVDRTNPLGRVDVVMTSEKNAIVSWLDAENDSTVIKYRQVSNSGSLGDEQIVSTSSASRGSGFPQMEFINGALYFAWTDLETKGVQVKRISLNSY